MILVGYTTYRYSERLLKSSEWLIHSNQIVRTSERLLFLIKGAEAQQRELLYHADSTLFNSTLFNDSTVFQPYLREIDSIGKCLQQLEYLLAHHELQKQKLDSLRELTFTQIDLMHHAIQLKAYNSSAAFRRFVVHDQDQQKETLAKIEHLLRKISGDYNQVVAGKTRELRRLLLRTRSSVLILLIAYLGVAVISFGFVYGQERKEQLNEQQLHKLTSELKQREEELQSSNYALMHNNEEKVAMYQRLEKLRNEFASIISTRTAKIKRANNRLIAEVIKRKRVGEDLQKSEERFRIALDNAPIIVFNQDRSLHYTWMYNNPSAPISSQDVVGKTDIDLFSRRDAEQMMMIKKEVLETGKGTSQEIELTLHRRKVHYLLTIEPIISNQQQVAGITGAAYDITQQKQSEAMLRDTLKELRRRNHELDNYVYKVSHDLRAPLVSILGLINLVKVEDNPDSYKKYMGLIENRVNKLDDFIKSVLNHSRTLNSEIRIVYIDFEKIIANCIEELHYLPNLEKLHISVEVNRNIDFYSDDLRIGIVLKNFISNAIKYYNPFAEHSYLRFDIEITEQQAKITIEDNGVGIEEQYLPRIFDMFFRGTPRSDGSGLGLYIVKQTVERLEGSVTVESEIGKGTKFRVLLPNFKGQG